MVRSPSDMKAYNDNGTGTHRKINDISSSGLPGEQRSALLVFARYSFIYREKLTFQLFKKKRKIMLEQSGKKLRSYQKVLIHCLVLI